MPHKQRVNEYSLLGNCKENTMFEITHPPIVTLQACTYTCIEFRTRGKRTGATGKVILRRMFSAYINITSPVSSACVCVCVPNTLQLLVQPSRLPPHNVLMEPNRCCAAMPAVIYVVDFWSGNDMVKCKPIPTHCSACAASASRAGCAVISELIAPTLKTCVHTHTSSLFFVSRAPKIIAGRNTKTSCIREGKSIYSTRAIVIFFMSPDAVNMYFIISLAPWPDRLILSDACVPVT